MASGVTDQQGCPACDWGLDYDYANYYNFCPECGTDLAKDTPRVYLAGPIQHSDTGGHGWRDAIVNQWPDRFEWVNPLDEIDLDLDDYSVKKDYQYIVDEDRFLLDSVDMVFVGWNHEIRSRGTMAEMVLCREDLDLPVALWNRTEADSDELSPWVYYYADKVSQDLPELLTWMEA